jgi:hypothetical protein
MALNSSGPISLGGTTTGQSIAIENGGNGTTQISLNDAAVRSLAGVASGAIVMPTNFYGKSNTASFIGGLTYPSELNATSVHSSVAVGTSAIFVVSLLRYQSITPERQLGIASYSLTGTLNFSKQIAPSSGNVIQAGMKCVADFSDNVYITVQDSTSLIFIKINSAGVIQFQKRLKDGASYVTPANQVFSMAMNASRTFVYITYYFTSSLLTKWNTDGTFIWGRYADFSGGQGTQGRHVAANDSYIVMVSHIETSQRSMFSFYDQDGNNTSNKSSGAPTYNNSYTGGLAIDSSGNMYIASNMYNGTRFNIIVGKCDSSMNWTGVTAGRPNGTLQYIYKSGNASQSIEATGITFDSSGNSYVVTSGAAAQSENTSMLIYKCDNTSTLLLRRKFNRTALDPSRVLAVATTSDRFVMVGSDTSIPGLTTFAAPQDGTLTGAYTNSGYSWTYAAETQAVVEPENANVPATVTPSTGTNGMTVETTTLTIANTALTSSITIMT